MVYSVTSCVGKEFAVSEPLICNQQKIEPEYNQNTYQPVRTISLFSTDIKIKNNNKRIKNLLQNTDTRSPSSFSLTVVQSASTELANSSSSILFIASVVWKNLFWTMTLL